MKVKEVIEVLSRVDPEIEVYISAGHGDAYGAKEEDFRVQEVKMIRQWGKEPPSKVILLPWWISGRFETEIENEKICPKCRGNGKIMKLKTV